MDLDVVFLGTAGSAPTARRAPAATRYADPREGVWELRERNDLEGTTIVPGQVLVLP